MDRKAKKIKISSSDLTDMVNIKEKIIGVYDLEKITKGCVEFLMRFI